MHEKKEWLITVGGGYGAMRFTGTREEAEARRRLKARQEGAVARLRCLDEAARSGTLTQRVEPEALVGQGERC